MPGTSAALFRLSQPDGTLDLLKISWLTAPHMVAIIHCMNKWTPDNLAVTDDTKYLCVDEVYDGIATILISDWPDVDDLGCLKFTNDIADAITEYWTDTDTLATHFGRPVRTGDVFAGTIDEQGPLTLTGHENTITLSADFTDVSKQAQQAVDVQHALSLYGPGIIVTEEELARRQSE